MVEMKRTGIHFAAETQCPQAPRWMLGILTRRVGGSEAARGHADAVDTGTRWLMDFLLAGGRSIFPFEWQWVIR